MLVTMTAGLLAGCGEGEQVTSYVVPKQHVLDAENHVARAPAARPPMMRPAAPATPGPTTEARMLAAMIPWSSQHWFFKVTGPPDEVAKHAETFTTFIKSVRFAPGADAKPEWTVPEGWQQAAGTAMRFATLRFGPSDAPLELTVIPLATAGESQAAYTLENVNRWRGQLGLPAIEMAALADETETIELDGTTATMVDLVGVQAAGGPMRAPFAGPQAPFAGRPGLAPPATVAAPTATPSIGYDTPEDWTKSALSVSRGGISVEYSAAFKVERDGESAEMTVTPLPPAMASMMLPMINRWRGQIQLGPVTQQQLDSQMQKIEIDGTTGDYIEIVGPADAPRPQTILAVVVVAADRAWFFKSIGDSRLVESEKEPFEAFVRSVKFGGSEEASDEN